MWGVRACLHAYFMKHISKSNNKNKFTFVLYPINKVCERTGACVCFMKHINKSNNKNKFTFVLQFVNFLA